MKIKFGSRRIFSPSLIAAFALVGFLGRADRAQAGIAFEPYAGSYTASSSGEVKASLSGTSSTSKIDGTFSGAFYGAKLGLSLLMLRLGADYMILNHGSSNANAVGPYLALGAGPFDLQASYFASSDWKDDDSTMSGNGFKAGIGLSLVSHLKVNAEYYSLHYTKYTTSAPTGGATIDSFDATISGGMLSLSLSF